MQEILPTAAEWVRRGRSCAVATVTFVGGSAPRDVGSSLVVSDTGEVFGNVSGGCVESAVYTAALEVIESRVPVVERFGYSDADAIAVGLTCGGTIEVLIRPVSPGSAAASDLLALATLTALGKPFTLAIDRAGAHLGRVSVLPDGSASDVSFAPSDETVIVHSPAPAHLVIIGAVEFAAALSLLGQAAGMRVTVVDARAVFATPARFPGAEVIVDQPGRWLSGQSLDRLDAVCVLSHDAKFDVPAVTAALASGAGYVGAMGSRRTHDDRMRRLRDAGVGDDDLRRLRSPLGLDLGGRSTAETAISILAEIVADRHGASAQRLSGRTGPVHARAVAAQAPTTSVSSCAWDESGFADATVLGGS